MIRFLLATSLLIFIVGCSTAEPVLTESKIDIPVMLTEDDTEDNRDVMYAAVKERLYKNSMFRKCDTQKKEVCIVIDVDDFENTNEIKVTYKSNRESNASIEAIFTASVKPYNQDRHRHVIVEKTKEEIDELRISGLKDYDELDVEVFVTDKEDAEDFEKTNSFLVNELILIQKDIATFHDKYTPYRFLSVTNDN